MAWALAAHAQQSDRVRLIGIMGGGVANDPNAQANIAAFLQALEKLGWTVGRNLRIESRQGAGNVDDTRKYAAEVVALAPGRHPVQWHREPGAGVAGDAHRADSVHDRRRPAKSPWSRIMSDGDHQGFAEPIAASLAEFTENLISSTRR